jgi:hypothetical protein
MQIASSNTKIECVELLTILVEMCFEEKVVQHKVGILWIARYTRKSRQNINSRGGKEDNCQRINYTTQKANWLKKE